MRTHPVAVALFVLFAALPAVAEQPPRTATPFLATHVGIWRADHVEWRSHFHVAELSTPYVVPFARPLPKGSRVEADPELVRDGATASAVLNAAGRIEAVLFAGAWGDAVVVTKTPTAGPIEPPLAVNGPQRVEISGARIIPAPPSPLVARLGQIRHRRIGYRDVARFRNARGVAKTQAIYVLPDDDFFSSGGLTSYTTPDAELQKSNFVVGASVLGLTLLLLGAGARRASVHARGEAAEAYLARVDPDLARDLSDG